MTRNTIVRSIPLTEDQLVSFLGIRVANLSVNELTDIIVECALNQIRLTLSFVNPHSFAVVQRNPTFIEELNAMDIIGADGIGVVWASKILLQKPLRERLSADLIAPSLLSRMEQHGLKLFLFGSRQGMAQKAAINLKKSFPRLQIVGTNHGYIQGEQQNRQLIDYINKCTADIVWVGLGAPLQERWIMNNAHLLSAPVMMTCGGIIHQVAERYPYYPDWTYRYRLNWLYRLCKEPGRLWRRYTIELIRFALMVLHTKLKS